MGDAARPALGSSYAAELLDGWSLAPLQVRVVVEAGGLRISRDDGSLLASWDAPSLRCDAMQEGVLHVSHVGAPEETLVIHDKVLEAHVLALRPVVQALPGGQSKLTFALVCLLALIGAGAALYHTTPLLARFIARRVPLEQERTLGAQMEVVLDMSSCKQAKAEAPLKQLVKTLGGEHFEVRIVEGSAPNAFALPGGIILVTDQLLRQAETADEVAGVLAHEIEHITQRHVLSGVIRDAILTGIWSITVGDYAGLLVLDPTTAYRVLNLEFSRADEAAADRGAVQRLHRAGLRHAGLATFFQRLEKRYGDHAPEWLSTHPSTAARIRELRATPDAKELLPALDDQQFALLRKGCD